MAETVRLAEHVANLRLADVPHELKDELKVLLLDYLGVALRGSMTGAAQVAAKFQAEYGSAKTEATIIGHGTRVTSQAAAFANAVASHSIELDDVDNLALYHFSPPVFSAAMAAAEAANASGRDFLLALAAGCDIMARLSNATNPMLRDRGYHTTPVCGVFGATAAVAKIEGLSAEQIASAFGIAGAHAGGLMEMYGPSAQKRLNPGPAAQNGVVAARMARMGFSGADTILEGTRGVLRAFAGQDDPSALVRGLGEKFPVYIEYKPYACARPLHNAIDCSLALRPRLLNRLLDITAMTLVRHPSWAHYHQIPAPRTYHEAQVSINHATAVALVEGAAFFDQFSSERIQHPDVQRLSRLLKVEVDPQLPRGVSCLLRIRLRTGEFFEAQVDYPRGSPENPLTAEDHRRKFETLAGSRLGAERLTQIRDAVENLESLPSVATVTALLC